MGLRLCLDRALKKHINILPCSEYVVFLLMVMAPQLAVTKHTMLKVASRCSVYGPRLVTCRTILLCGAGPTPSQGHMTCLMKMKLLSTLSVTRLSELLIRHHWGEVVLRKVSFRCVHAFGAISNALHTLRRVTR